MLQCKLYFSWQYREEVNELNEFANHRPKSTLVLGSHEENVRIHQLQQENIELQTSLAEYQSALELIMNKYREQVSLFIHNSNNNKNNNNNNFISALHKIALYQKCLKYRMR